MSCAESDIVSARPQMTAEIMAQTGLDERKLSDPVHRFYDKVRKDAVLGPIFAERIDNWDPHLERMVAFWSSVALMTGRHHGAPMPGHVSLPVEWRHFERWLALFRETADETCPPEGADHVVERAERIARSLLRTAHSGHLTRNATAALQRHRTGHSCIVQHFEMASDGRAGQSCLWYM